MLNYCTYPSDKFKTFWIFNMLTCSSSIPWYLWPIQSWGMNLNMWTCWRSKMFETRHMLLLLFCLNKDPFWFLLMLRTSSAEVRQEEKNLAGKYKLIIPQDSYRGEYYCKWKIFTISTTLWKGFNVNCHVLQV